MTPNSKVLKTFSFGTVQNLLAMLDAIEAAGHTVDDVRAYVRAKREALEAKERIRSVALARRCPKCGQQMGLAPVNTGPRDHTGDDSTFVWICPRCQHEEWTDKPLRRIIHEAHGGRAPGARPSDCAGARSPFDGLPRPKCPQCGRPMRIGSVNTCAATRIGGWYKSVWYCPAVRECGHCEYSPRTVGQWRRDLEAKKGGRNG